MKTRTAFFISLLLLTALSSGAGAETAKKSKDVIKRPLGDTVTLPFKSSEEDLEFDSRIDNPMMSMGRDETLLGLIVRAHTEREPLRVIEVYGVKEAPLQMNEPFCEKVIKKILNMQPDFPMSLKKSAVFPARFGKACEVTVIDEDPIAKERRIFVTNIGSKAYVFLFKFPKGVGPKDQEEMRDFIKSLH